MWYSADAMFLTLSYTQDFKKALNWRKCLMFYILSSVDNVVNLAMIFIHRYYSTLVRLSSSQTRNVNKIQQFIQRSSMSFIDFCTSVKIAWKEGAFNSYLLQVYCILAILPIDVLIFESENPTKQMSLSIKHPFSHQIKTKYCFNLLNSVTPMINFPWESFM